jgi:probable phosphoglycerate mutase
MAAWLASPAVAPPGGESFDDVAARVGRALARIRDAHPAGRVAVVSHVSPIKLILRAALDGGPAFLHRCYLDPAGVSTVDYWSDGGVAVRAVNEIPGAI